MKNPLLIANMQRFYSLEKGAVQIYNALAEYFQDQEVHDFLIKFRDIEQTHVDFWEQVLAQYNKKPQKQFGTISAFAGRLASHGLGQLPASFALKAAYYIEYVAMWDYAYFGKKLRQVDTDLAEGVWNLKADEELHGIWLKQKGEELAQQKNKIQH